LVLVRRNRSSKKTAQSPADFLSPVHEDKTKETTESILKKHHSDIDISLHIVPPGCHYDSDEEEEEDDEDKSVVINSFDDESTIYTLLNDIGSNSNYCDDEDDDDDIECTERTESVSRFTDRKPISRQRSTDDLPCIPRRRGSFQDINASALSLGSSGDSFSADSFSSLVE
jgi:hypothetical protein